MKSNINIETQWILASSTQEPIEAYFERLEKVFILVNKYPATKIHHRLDSGEVKDKHGKVWPLSNALLEWNAFTTLNQDWGNPKSHIGKAYKNLIMTGLGVGLSGAIANVLELYDDDNESLGTTTDVVRNMQMATDTNAQAIRDNATVMRQELTMLRVEIQVHYQGATKQCRVIQWAPPVAPPIQ
jgi:hypothetical protein